MVWFCTVNSYLAKFYHSIYFVFFSVSLISSGTHADFTSAPTMFMNARGLFMNFASNNEKIGACWVNGNLVDPLEASVSAVDHAIVVGDVVFETLKVTQGVPFAVSRHIKR